MLFSCRFAPGDVVKFGEKGDIVGIVERVIFARNMTEPLLAIDWWMDGEQRTSEFHYADVRPA